VKLVHSFLTQIVYKRSSTTRYDDPFFNTRAWLELRYQVILVYGPHCMCCRRSNIEIISKIEQRCQEQLARDKA